MSLDQGEAGMRRRTFMAGLGAAAAVPVLAGQAQSLSVGAMRSDVALLRRAYGTLHPGLLRYQSPAQAAARFDALAAAAVRPMGQGDFYLALARCLSGVRCGHSYANFYNQSKAVQAALFDARPRLPLRFVWLGDRMIVTDDPQHTGIARGSEIVAIDGRPAREILAALIPLTRADGHNDDKRRQLLSVRGEDGYETFDILHGLRFGGGPRYALDVRAPDGRRRRAVVEGIDLKTRRSSQVPTNDTDNPGWRVERRGRAAVMTMPGWGLYDSKWDWRGWIDAEMDRLAADRVPALIVDLRENEGGEDCGNVLLERIVTRPVVADTARRLVRYRELPADLRPYCDTWDRSFDTLGVDAKPLDGRFLELAGTDRDGAVIAPRGRRYEGRLIVLAGPENSSATFGFIQTVGREKLGTLVGEPTGGNRRGINGGCFYFFRLPETGLEADLPLIGSFPRVMPADAGIVPDVAAPRTPRSIAEGSDPAMAAALRLVAA